MGAHLETRGAAIGKPQDVVVEAILLVPHAFCPCLVHGSGDPKEMVSKLDGHFFVHRIIGPQLLTAMTSSDVLGEP